MLKFMVMHDDEEVGSAEYDFRKLFNKKKLKFSTWLDLKYEDGLVGKIGLCLWLELDFLKDIVDDIYRRTCEATRRLYLVKKREIEVDKSLDNDVARRFRVLMQQ